MNGIILPKVFISKENLSAPLIFLAGPIKGAPNWQDEAIKILFSNEPNLIIASPKREISKDLEKYILSGKEDYFERTRKWERYYLEVASKKGAILFWLPEEVNHQCEKAYGAMTRLELGQWMTRYSLDNSLKFCVGSDGNFSEVKTIKVDLSEDAPNKIIHNTLEKVCCGALELSKLKV